MNARQSGAALLVPVIAIITVAAFAVVVAASQSGADARNSSLHADSVEALYLAETGVERALKRFASQVANCGATAPTLAETITDLSQLGFAASAGRRIEILEGLTTAFDGVTALPARTQCRVRVTATIDASNVSRTIHAIVDRNLLEGPDNPAFDNPLTGTPPSGWAGQNPATAFAPNGGADGTAPNCLRSAWTARQNPGAAANNRRATATAAVAASVAGAAPNTTTVAFHRRALTRSNDCGASLPAAGPAALPAYCGAALDSSVCFQLIGLDNGGTPRTWTVGSNVNPAVNSAQAACPSVFNPCTTNYQAGAPTTKVVLTKDMTQADGAAFPATVAVTPASVSSVVYWLQLQNAGRKELFVDYIEVTNPYFVGAAHVKVWRDCSTATDPTTCLN